MPQPSLPLGVTPSQAGRAWAWKWLQGQSNHRRREKRRKHRARTYKLTLLGRWLSLICPYRTNEHPGAEELVAQVLGLTEMTAEKYVASRTDHMSAEGMRSLARWLQRQYEEAQVLIRDLERAAAEKDARNMLNPRTRGHYVKSAQK